ncbi:ribbon-helix-helix domain-containing protein [Pelagibius sp. Alg239-R121]|uniref:ribbon-helix-helix domain-containing protein n=1 Tax=Pelagibius sp. Alg239-R121 TaxID=2993448 RepID=UPI0024A62C1B|nr:ribbon-helix-helix domain-containing protein [Pelagibius sp. Alg239-R121]
MARPAQARPSEQEPKPRIVQFNNRRYSIRLEPVFWRGLEDLAARNQLRLGKFVAQMEETYQGKNFSSFLRVFCMLDAERGLAEQHLGDGRASLVDLVEACPTPGVILSHERTIIACNAAFTSWLGTPGAPVVGADLTAIVQVRTRRSLNEVWQDMVNGGAASIDARILHVAPGRVSTAQGKILALPSNDPLTFYSVMWLTIAPQAR